MAARPVAAGSISFGLVSIPVKLFTATRSKSVSFKLLHGKDKSRIQQRIYCPPAQTGLAHLSGKITPNAANCAFV